MSQTVNHNSFFKFWRLFNKLILSISVGTHDELQNMLCSQLLKNIKIFLLKIFSTANFHIVTHLYMTINKNCGLQQRHFFYIILLGVYDN